MPDLCTCKTELNFNLKITIILCLPRLLFINKTIIQCSRRVFKKYRISLQAHLQALRLGVTVTFVHIRCSIRCSREQWNSKHTFHNLVMLLTISVTALPLSSLPPLRPGSCQTKWQTLHVQPGHARKVFVRAAKMFSLVWQTSYAHRKSLTRPRKHWVG